MTIRTNGKTTHCEVFFLAGQKNATNGNAGLWEPAFLSDLASSLLDVVEGGSPFFFFLALYGERVAGMAKNNPQSPKPKARRKSINNKQT